MTKDNIGEWTEVNKLSSKLSDEERQKLYQELKRSGSVELPAEYVNTHLEHGFETEDD
ncbi:hypothetical protein [Dendrosporobacter sp. 1207_IL3150]|uniref:hypothetical protein n=1 Tax=Dendrosporobacter sp. 1207_IL3150 TaxID=3084054 RepID=UPI002FDB9594